MAFDWEQTFRKWSKPSSDSECERQENAERLVSEAVRAYEPLKTRDIKIIAQGSYRNNTNVRQESDVDICVCCMDTFFADYSYADYSDSDVGNVNSVYAFPQLKAELQSALEAKFGKSGVRRGDKALDVHATSYRVDSDIVPAFAYRIYLKQQINPATGTYRRLYIEPPGTKFLSDSGKIYTNWPEQHYSRGVEKNVRTGGRFKLIVRAVKRLKFYLADKKIIDGSLAASYLIECLLYNVPDPVFSGESYADNVRSALLTCFTATQADVACANWEEVNGIKLLFHATQPWTRKQANEFALAAWYYVHTN